MTVYYCVSHNAHLPLPAHSETLQMLKLSSGMSVSHIYNLMELSNKGPIEIEREIVGIISEIV